MRCYASKMNHSAAHLILTPHPYLLTFRHMACFVRPIGAVLLDAIAYLDRSSNERLTYFFSQLRSYLLFSPPNER